MNENDSTHDQCEVPALTEADYLAAAKAGSTIFFAPNNPVDKEVLKANPKALSNYDEAVKTVKEEGLDIEVVPVTNVKEAIAYLEKTKEK